MAPGYSTRIVRGMHARSQAIPATSRANSERELTSGLTHSYAVNRTLHKFTNTYLQPSPVVLQFLQISYESPRDSEVGQVRWYGLAAQPVLPIQLSCL